MRKAEALTYWKSIPEGMPILSKMTPIPYKAAGSKYGACGIRIDGNPQFVDAVLSRIKDVLDGENHITRLELSRSPAVKGFKAAPNADRDAEVCYVRLHMRGREGAIASAVFDQELAQPTQRYADAIGA